MKEAALLAIRSAAAAPWGEALLRDIDFTLARGETVAVVGPNGAGKSTLLHALAGGIALSSGEIRLHGRPLQDYSRLERARAIAMLPQHSPLGFPFSVAEVVLLGRTPHATGSAEDHRILEAVLEATDSTALRGRRYTELSGGEQQRVQLARVLAQIWPAADSPPGLLLLDEPTAGLDLAHQQLLRCALKRLCGQGIGTVAVLHDFNLAAAFADRVLVLQAGRQVDCGPPERVYTESMFREVFDAEVQLVRDRNRRAPLVVQP